MEDEKKLENKKRIFIGLGILILIALIVCFVIAFNNTKNSNTYTVKDNNVTTIDYENIDYGATEDATDSILNITKGGTYNLSGTYESVTINTEDAVKLVLDNVTIDNENGPAIYVENAKVVNIELNGTNKITSNTTEDLDGAIYSKDDLVLSGEGSLEVKSNYDGIVSKDSLVIESGTYVIEAEQDGIKGKDSATINGGEYTINAKDDGIHSDGLVEINGGIFNITAAEGIEGTYIKINDGTINIEASDDGINAANKSTDYSVTVEINGGNITIKMGQGDTDGIDSNGNLYINGGTINITGQSPFDYDGEAKYNGGTMIVNGEETTEITNQFAGGMIQGGEKRGNMPSNENGNPPEMDGNFVPGEFTDGERPTPPDGNFGEKGQKPQGERKGGTNQ